MFKRLFLPAVVLSVFGADVFAASLYQCKAASGGGYWSSEWCSKSGGFTVNIVSVPNVPFDQQVQIAEQGVQARQQAQAASNNARSTALTCGAIDSELTAIWSRYSDGKYVPAEEVGSDRIRTRELEAKRSRLGCQSR